MYFKDASLPRCCQRRRLRRFRTSTSKTRTAIARHGGRTHEPHLGLAQEMRVPHGSSGRRRAIVGAWPGLGPDERGERSQGTGILREASPSGGTETGENVLNINVTRCDWPSCKEEAEPRKITIITPANGSDCQAHMYALDLCPAHHQEARVLATRMVLLLTRGTHGK